MSGTIPSWLSRLSYASNLAIERKGRFSLDLARSIAVDFAVSIGVATSHKSFKKLLCCNKTRAGARDGGLRRTAKSFPDLAQSRQGFELSVGLISAQSRRFNFVPSRTAQPT